MLLELNRLKAMPEIYDKKLFNYLYSKTSNLRNKLARQIDCRRFGVEYEDILSSFDIKFIFVFNKFHKEPEEILLGMMLNSLKNFKCRILRSAYTNKFSQNILRVDDILTKDDHLSEDHPHYSNKHDYQAQLMQFMKTHLSMNAYTVFEVKLNPPPYMHCRLNTHQNANLQKIPDQLILEYFDLGESEKAYKYLDTLKKEIRNTINFAKIHFKDNL